MKDVSSKVDCVLKKHSGVGVKTLRFNVGAVYSMEDCCLLDSWLHSVVKPGIEELSLTPPGGRAYKFPYSLLSDGTGDSLRHLNLANCHLHTTQLVCFKRLTILNFDMVYISEDELECLLSNSFSLEQLKLYSCSKIVCLRIPRLQQLSSLVAHDCSKLQVIENKAPNLSFFSFLGRRLVQFSLGVPRSIKTLKMIYDNAAFYACTELPSSMPKLEALHICSCTEAINTPMVDGKFLHLKFLDIMIGGHGYDFLSLVSYFNSSPSLETFKLHVLGFHEEQISMALDPLNLRTVPGHLHDKLRSVEIINFGCAKSLIELTCHILQSTRSLQCLTLDTTNGYRRCSRDEFDKCVPMCKIVLVEALRALLAIQTYIKPNVPPTVEFTAVEPCKCHAQKMKLLSVLVSKN